MEKDNEKLYLENIRLHNTIAELIAEKKKRTVQTNIQVIMPQLENLPDDVQKACEEALEKAYRNKLDTMEEMRQKLVSILQ